MSVYSAFKTDKTLEEAGIWLNYGDFKIKIARAGGGNKRFENSCKNRLKGYERALQIGALSNDKANELMQEIYAESVILDWEGVEDEQGNQLEFNKANVVKVLKDLPELFKDIEENSKKIALFRQDVLEKDSKN
jgi:hypothetical protein